MIWKPHRWTCNVVWNNPHGRSVGLTDRLVMWTPLFHLTPDRVGISQAEQKNNHKQRTEGGRKKQKITDLELQYAGRGSLAPFKHSCMHLCTAISRTQRKSFTATKDADLSDHCLHCSLSSFLTPYYLPTALDPRLRADWPAPRLGLEMSDSRLRSFVTVSQRPSSFFSGLVRLRGPSSLCDLRAKIDKGVPLDDGQRCCR